MARILIVGGGCRGLALARSLLADGNAVRITTRREQGRAAIEAAGAECWIGTPDRLATLRGSLDGVALLCWLLGNASGAEQELIALFGTRLEYLLSQSIDTTVRGFVYERSGSAPAALLEAGEQVASSLTGRNQIPLAFLDADPAGADPAVRERWLTQARVAIDGLLAGA
ncbi:MAG: NAD-dependent epimerase/dehydratase family protein [Solirubrobacteraceae bacterium]